MENSVLFASLKRIFIDESLYGFSAIDGCLAARTGCKCAVVTLMPYPDMNNKYNAVEYFEMLEVLRKEHSARLDLFKRVLDENEIHYATPPASPDDDEYWAEFSYKWAAIHAGLGFMGRNDVFVHEKYAQRVRISCLLIDHMAPILGGEIVSKCGACMRCKEACPHHFISGDSWHYAVKREALINYKKCAMKSKHEGEGMKYLCTHCLLACTYPIV